MLSGDFAISNLSCRWSSNNNCNSILQLKWFMKSICTYQMATHFSSTSIFVRKQTQCLFGTSNEATWRWCEPTSLPFQQGFVGIHDINVVMKNISRIAEHVIVVKFQTSNYNTFWDTNFFYRPRSKGDNTFGSVRPSVRLFVCVRSLVSWHMKYSPRPLCVCQ